MCHVFDRALLSTAISILPSLANRTSCSISLRLFCISSFISKYMLAARNDMPSYIISNTTVSSSESFEISIAPMLLFVIINAALCFPVPAVYIRYCLLIPVGLFLYSYSSCIKSRSGYSDSIFFIRLSVAVLEC